MSRGNLQPLAAFFPPIGRNLLRDLDRQLRHAAMDQQRELTEEMQSAPEPAHEQQRPSIPAVLEAIDRAASSMLAMSQRIVELEAEHSDLETANAQLKTKLEDLLQLQQASEKAIHAETARAAQAEDTAAQHLSRVQTLERDLEAAVIDLDHVTAAIMGRLGTRA